MQGSLYLKAHLLDLQMNKNDLALQCYDTRSYSSRTTAVPWTWLQANIKKSRSQAQTFLLLNGSNPAATRLLAINALSSTMSHCCVPETTCAWCMARVVIMLRYALLTINEWVSRNDPSSDRWHTCRHRAIQLRRQAKDVTGWKTMSERTVFIVNTSEALTKSL